MLRKAIVDREGDMVDGFRHRGREVSRLEGFSDAAFAFAVTLLVISLEVPNSFDGLLDVLRGLPAFAVCFG
ncbi:MAG TPA: TMEM175 family protein, partial [Phycisphaerales bacterium]|nr:TMEM175 family protein [Phycisphaerales bacterium]